MVVFGLSHFAYADFTASMIPAWMPARLILAYVTGAAHLAAGAALLLGVVPGSGGAAGGDHDERLHRPGARAGGARATVEPRAVDGPVVAAALAGAMWVVFGSFSVKFRRVRT